ncbi:MAG: hypothetical protein Tsb0013_10700 [Phycisphaerales bacterium]
MASADRVDAYPMGIEEASPELRAHVADQMVRAARRRLLITESPQPVEYRLVAELIAGARSLVPPDPELLRLEIEARVAGLQDDVAASLARELLAVAPDDEVAQLRVAIDAVKRRQTAEGRLEAYELFLGARGEGLRKAVRSRLAVDAALLARERGSERLFIEYITLATTLDPSNKEAAALYASHFLALSDDPVERIDLLTNIVLSDPMDPEALQNLSLELVQHGAYRGAFAVLRHTVRLYSLRREQLPLRMRVELTLAEWNTKGTDHLLDYTQDLEETLRQRIAGEREFAISQGLDPGEEQPPLLPLELEALRLAAGVVERDEQLIRRMLDKCLAVGANSIPGLRDSTEDPQLASRRVDAMRLTLLWCRAFAGLDLDAIKQEFAYFTDPDNPNALGEDARDRFAGWIALLEGDIERAEALVAPIVERDRHAKWVMGLIEEARGNTREALRHFAGIAQRYPNTAIGTAAWFRTQELHGGDLVRSPEAERLSDEAERLVDWLDGRFDDPASYMTIEVRPVTTPLDPFDGAVLELMVRNRTSWPLGIGDGEPIPSQVLLTPIVTFGTGDLVEATKPESISVPGRLRLNGNEEVTFRVRTARRLVADLYDIGAVQRSTARWQAALGFAHDGRRPVPTPLSVSAQTRLAGIRALDADADTQDLIDAIESTAGVTRAVAIRSAMLGASQLAMQQLGMQENLIAQRRSVLLNAFAAEFPGWSELERASGLFALTMPVVRVIGPEFDVFRGAIEPEPSPYVISAIAAGGGIRDLDNPMLRSLENAPQPWARALALHIADSIRIANRLLDLSREVTGEG